MSLPAVGGLTRRRFGAGARQHQVPASGVGMSRVDFGCARFRGQQHAILDDIVAACRSADFIGTGWRAVAGKPSKLDLISIA